jgi:hypothetical protein
LNPWPQMESPGQYRTLCNEDYHRIIRFADGKGAHDGKKGCSTAAGFPPKPIAIVANFNKLRSRGRTGADEFWHERARQPEDEGERARACTEPPTETGKHHETSRTGGTESFKMSTRIT